MVDYNLEWPDLPDYSPLAQLPSKWARGWKWANTKLLFERTEAVPVSVTREQHERLKRNLTSVANVSYSALAHSLAGWANGAFKPFDAAAANDATKKRGKAPRPSNQKLVWPEGFSKLLMDPLMVWARGAGYVEKSTEWMAVERGAAHALDVCRGRVLAGEAPRLPFSGELPGGVSVRLGAGRQYGRPLGGEGREIILGDLGAVLAAVAPAADKPRALCEYVEAAHWNRSWHVRFVYMNAKPPKCLTEGDAK